MEKNIHCTLTDIELFGKAEELLSELIETGGKSFVMQVPARPNKDTDLILAEVISRFKKLVTPRERSKSVDQEWDEFWKGIICNEDGTINMQELKNNLYDFSFVLEQVPKVYCHITGNTLSKVMYKAETVISVADDYFNKELEEAVKTELDEQEIEDSWISVEDRLPEEGGRYWCYVEEITDLGISHYQWNCYYHPTDKSWSDRFVPMYVTHWRPLPEPPKK